LAHRSLLALLRMAASGRSGHKIFGRPRLWRDRALSRGRATTRPSPQAVSARLGHDRSAKNIGGIRYARFHDANNQDWSHHLACMLHRGSRINLYPVERQWLVPKSCILVAARLQDGWDSSLVRLIRPTRHPQSHIRPGFGPEAWAKLIQLVKLSSDDCAGWYLPGLDVSPESDHQFARERDDHDAPDPTLEVPDALVIPER
jgi:hypothetical protein